MKLLADTLTSQESDWGLEALLDTSDRRDLLRRAEALSDFEGVGRMERLFRARAWAWCEFLWFGKSRKFRKRLLAFAELELAGRGGDDAFTKAIWGKREPDWEALEKDFDSHLERLLKKAKLK